MTETLIIAPRFCGPPGSGHGGYVCGRIAAYLDDAIAADQRISAWARQLKQAGLDGSTDQLRARAYLDILLGRDSRRVQPATDSRRAQPATDSCPAQSADAPAGFAAKVNLTVPVTTAQDLADRPGEISGIGPIDPWLARDLVRAAAQHPRTSWCVTVTDGQGHAIGHGCARPESKRHRRPEGPRPPPGGTEFCLIPASRDGPPGGYGTWRLRTGGAGPDLIVAVDPITTQDCDHRFAAKGHDPGVKPAAGPPPRPISNITSPMRRADGLASATRAPSADTTTG